MKEGLGWEKKSSHRLPGLGPGGQETLDILIQRDLHPEHVLSLDVASSILKPPREEPRFGAIVLFKLNGTELTERTQLQPELFPVSVSTWERVAAAAQLSAITAAHPNLQKDWV